MSLTPSTYTYIGKGKIGIEKTSAGGGHRYVGGSLKLSLAISTEDKTTPNLETAGGGNLNKISRIKDMTGTLDLQEFTADNLALALRGLFTEESSGVVAAEAHTMYTGTINLLDYLRDTTVAAIPVIAVSAARVDTTAYAVGDTILDTAVVYQCTTAGTSAGSAPTFNATVGDTTTDGTVTWTSRGAVAMVDGTDYQVGVSAVEILDTATRFEGGLPVTVGYTKNNAYLVQLLTDSQADYSLVFDGLNEADSGMPAPSKLHKVKFTPTTGLEQKGDDFGTLSLSFEVLPDTTISGTGLSQYGLFRVARA